MTPDEKELPQFIDSSYIITEGVALKPSVQKYPFWTTQNTFSFILISLLQRRQRLRTAEMVTWEVVMGKPTGSPVWSGGS